MTLQQDLHAAANKEKAAFLQRFFKTGKGQYAEGDVLLGINVPVIRAMAKKYGNIPLSDVTKALHSKYHEERLAGLLILVHKYEKNADERKNIFEFYIDNLKSVNNWDLVDLSADKIMGRYLFEKDKKILYTLAKSKNVWERRVAIIATFYFIKNNSFDDTCKIAELLLQDSHDLIHKAVGWMLREVGKRDQAVLEKFLKQHYKTMPRTMLRYAIERFPEPLRKQYLHGTI